MAETVQNRLARGRTADVYNYSQGRVLKHFHAGGEAVCDAEYKIATYLNAFSLPAPKAYEKIMLDGRPAIIYGAVSGPNMQFVLENDCFEAWYCAKRMAAVHYIVHQTQAGHLAELKQVLRHTIKAAALPPDLDKAYILDYLEGLPGGETLCHMNFQPNNIIEGPKAPAVVDWLMACRGDAAADVCKSYILLGSPVQAAGLKGARKWLQRGAYWVLQHYYRYRYLRLAELSRARVEQWMLPLAAARYAEGEACEQRYLEAIMRKRLERFKRIDYKRAPYLNPPQDE